MPNRIKPKRSYTANAVPTTSDLDTHELAINWADSKAFTKNVAGQIVSVTLGGGGGSGEDAALRALFVPPAPTGLAATAGNGQATLSWTAPTGVIAQAPITDYREQFSTDGGTTWTTFTAAASTATTATVTGLTNGTAYVFRVAAVNAVGVGAYTAASAAVTPANPVFRAIPILTSATSSGEASASAILSGGLDAWRAFDKATVTSDDTFYASASPATNNWIQYDFGSGVSSNIGGYSITPRYLASYGDSGTGASQAPASWTLSGSNDGTNFTTIDTRNSPQSFSWGQARTFTLASAVNYRVFRWTWTSNPAGGAVIVPKIQLLSPLPDAPTSLTATGGNAQVSLAWTAPSYNGGSAITDYSVQFSTNSGSTWTNVSRTASTTASQVVTGLTNGTAYVFRVAGINSNGTGTYTAASSSVTPAAGPTVTGGTVTTPGDGYTYRTFTSSGDLVISGASLTCDVLVVGGGGPGSWGRSGGGGGGGGVLHAINQSIAAGSYPITVAGTTTRSSYPNATSNGGSSSIASIYVATGGSGGIVYGSYRHRGGTSGFPTTTSNSAGNSGGFGYGESDSVDPDGGGSGGGAGGAGQNARNWESAPGGAGRTVFGTVYGRGGRGGAEGLDARVDGTANRGEGGSGGQNYSTNTSGNGGSGVVIIRYAVA
jgi:hypothetical protein